MQKRLIAISDISCIGKCSLMTAAPILSALGHECAVLPTSVLSAHTAVFPEYTIADLTDPLAQIIAHWQKRQVSFDGILTGYLTGPEQSKLIESFLQKFGKADIPIVVDPILGDHGRLYAGFTPYHVTAAASLCRHAQYILPNITEAALLLGQTPPEDIFPEAPALAAALAKDLTALGPSRVIITGVPKQNKIGIVGYDAETATLFEHYTPRQEGVFHGTGDIFAASFFGSLCLSTNWHSAATAAADFTAECVAVTAVAADRRPYGVHFEQCLCRPVFQKLKAPVQL